jgi:hypothetical protein
MGNCRRAKYGVFLKAGARHAFGGRDLLQNGEAVRVSKRPANSANLRVRHHHARPVALRSHTGKMSFPGKRFESVRAPPYRL